MSLAVFLWQILVSKEVMCLVLWKHVFTRRVFACMAWAGPRFCSLCWTMMERFGWGTQGQMSQWGCGKFNPWRLLLASVPKTR